MSHLAQAWPAQSAPAPTVSRDSAKELYFKLSEDTDAHLPQARQFLNRQLELARDIESDLPANVNELAEWIESRTDAIGLAYRDYLAARKNGAPRRYFSSKSHALYFLKAVAPTKLVDGAWLYGVLRRWNDPDFHALIKIYLEELGEGLPDKNHVVLYKKLLATHGCEQWDKLSDEHFVQGAIQLSLAYDAEHFLPELIGFNLGYEQLPLHLLITAYELNELGIDPYYFTLHITVDNAATGHALNALQGVQQLMPRVGDAGAFFRRVVDGYRLNELGTGTTSAIESFDLEAELVNILAAKAVVGKNMHSDYCRVAGRTVNDWLAKPEQIPDFLRALEANGWIKRGEDPENSRFWRLVHGDRAEMFGVFSAYEQQVLHDWIASGRSGSATDEVSAPRVLSHRAQQRLLDTLGQERPARPTTPRGLIRHHLPAQDVDGDGFGAELRKLEEQIAGMASKEDAMQALIGLMSPATHHTAVGLMATRMFGKMLG
jgi:hypothetical protein